MSSKEARKRTEMLQRYVQNMIAAILLHIGAERSEAIGPVQVRIHSGVGKKGNGDPIGIVDCLDAGGTAIDGKSATVLSFGQAQLTGDIIATGEDLVTVDEAIGKVLTGLALVECIGNDDLGELRQEGDLLRPRGLGKKGSSIRNAIEALGGVVPNPEKDEDGKSIPRRTLNDFPVVPRTRGKKAMNADLLADMREGMTALRKSYSTHLGTNGKGVARTAAALKAATDKKAKDKEQRDAKKAEMEKDGLVNFGGIIPEKYKALFVEYCKEQQQDDTAETRGEFLTACMNMMFEAIGMLPAKASESVEEVKATGTDG